MIWSMHGSSETVVVPCFSRVLLASFATLVFGSWMFCTRCLQEIVLEIYHKPTDLKRCAQTSWTESIFTKCKTQMQNTHAKLQWLLWLHCIGPRKKKLNLHSEKPWTWHVSWCLQSRGFAKQWEVNTDPFWYCEFAVVTGIDLFAEFLVAGGLKLSNLAHWAGMCCLLAIGIVCARLYLHLFATFISNWETPSHKNLASEPTPCDSELLKVESIL